MAHAMTRSLQPLRSWYTLAVQVPVLPELLLARTLEPGAAAVRAARPPRPAVRAAVRQPSALHGPLAWYRAAGRRPPWQVLDAVGAAAAERDRADHLRLGAARPGPGTRGGAGHPDHVSGDYLFVELDAGHWLPELHPDEVAGAVLGRVRHAA